MLIYVHTYVLAGRKIAAAAIIYAPINPMTFQTIDATWLMWVVSQTGDWGKVTAILSL